MVMAQTAPKVRKTIAFLLFLLLAAMLGLAGRIAWIQMVDGPKLAAKAKSQLQESKTLQSPRGTIYDRNGRELAISSLTKSLYVNPQLFNKDAVTMANQLAPLLGMKSEDISRRLVSPGAFIWIKRTLEPDVAQKIISMIKEQNIKGLEFVEESKRYYPNNRLAAHVLGFVGVDDTGLDGIEMSMDKTIKGISLQQALDTDNQGIPIFGPVCFLTRSNRRKACI